MTHTEWDAFIEQHPYEAPAPDASRAPCPFLNTFANHGILPRDGKNVTFDDFYKAMTLAGVSPLAAKVFLQFTFRAYKEFEPSQPMTYDWTPAAGINLHQLGQHNILEHDVSLSRLDVSEKPDFTHPDQDRVRSLMALAHQGVVGGPQVAEFRRKIWMDSINKPFDYHFGIMFQLNAGVECALLLNFLGRDHQISVEHLESFLLNERIPDDWYPMEKPLATWPLAKRVNSCIKSVRETHA
ncbi:Chloroperoxidase [Chlamydoabsidia padenii]|nr:Chloroperoxidase [Chlamydoabsidia padenii]